MEKERNDEYLQGVSEPVGDMEKEKSSNEEENMFETVDKDFDPIADFHREIKRQMVKRSEQGEHDKMGSEESGTASATVRRDISESSGMRKGRRQKVQKVTGAVEEIRFMTDAETKFIVTSYLSRFNRSMTREEFFRTAVREQIRRLDPELYRKLGDAGAIIWQQGKKR